MSILNELRRRLYEGIKPVEVKQIDLPATPHLKSDGAPARWIFKTDDKNLVKELPRADEIIYQLSLADTPMDLSDIDKSNLRLALPPILRPEHQWRMLVKQFLSAGFIRWEIGNLAGLDLLPKGMDISLDGTVSVFNASALEESLSMGLSRATFSVEDTRDNIEALSKKSGQMALVLYQDTPLFLSANCVRENDCAHCKKDRQEREITNGKGRYRLISENCLTVLTDVRPFALPPMAQDLPVGFFRIDFINRHYTPAEALKIIKNIRNREKITPSFSGNFEKQFAS